MIENREMDENDMGRTAFDQDARAIAPGMVLDRRTLLGGTAALCVVASSAALPRFPASPDGPVRFVISDRRFQQSEEFAKYLEQYGAESLDVSGGLTALWQERLVPHWRDSRGMVAGLTTRAVWDGLSQQALGQFRKPRLVGQHRFAGSNGKAFHQLDLPAAPLRMLGSSSFDDDAWPVRMAQLVRQCARDGGADRGTCRIGRPPRDLHETNQLISWMIA